MKHKKTDPELFSSVKFIRVSLVVWFGNHWLKIKINHITTNQSNYRTGKTTFHNFSRKMTCRPVNINIIATELRDLRPSVKRSLCFQSGFQFTVQLTIIIKSYDLHQTRGLTWHYQAMYLTASKGNELWDMPNNQSVSSSGAKNQFILINFLSI